VPDLVEGDAGREFPRRQVGEAPGAPPAFDPDDAGIGVGLEREQLAAPKRAARAADPCSRGEGQVGLARGRDVPPGAVGVRRQSLSGAKQRQAMGRLRDVEAPVAARAGEVDRPGGGYERLPLGELGRLSTRGRRRQRRRREREQQGSQ
jgi:hypothetical protein